MLCFPFLYFLLSFVSAATVSYDWSIDWVDVNPDGQAVRPAIGVNGAWPGPAIEANVGDTLSVTVTNNLGNESTAIHWHGIHQEGTNQMDGPPNVVACPIGPGDSFTYEFSMNQTGTYWWHSHAAGQYTDGLRGPLIIHDPSPPYQWDEELVITLTDWYHDQMPDMLQYYLNVTQNPSGGEPVPYAGLLNEAQNTKYNVQPNKTYFVRVINMAAFSQFSLSFEHHNLTIIEVDGVYTEPAPTKDLYVAIAQRYGVLMKTKATAKKNFPILASLDEDDFDSVPSYVNQNVTGWLVYDSSAPFPAAATNKTFRTIDDFTLVPQDGQPLLPSPDRTINLELDFFTAYNENRAGWNNISYVAQKVPALYSAISAPPMLANNPVIYGANSNPHVLKYNDIIDIRIYNSDTGPHPVHIHGHQPQLIERTPQIYNRRMRRAMNHRGRVGQHSYELGGRSVSYPAVPMRRDTWLIAPGGYTTIRFQANNPGVWLLHCHMEWHVEAGLMATIIEAPSQIQAHQSTINPQMQTICKAQNVSLVGNAAANSKNWTDLSGANTSPGLLYGALWP